MKIFHKPLILLAVIYLAFISLGLPDGILGVAWPTARAELGLPLESMGVLTTSLLFMSAFSSFASMWALNKWGTGGVAFLSGAMTGGALLGYALSPGFFWLLLCTVPLGLGQGAVDSGLNRYVAEHYSARHMNWLHCFWGVGASLGPLLMTRALSGHGWRSGYRTVSVMQLCLTAVLLASLMAGLWSGDRDRTGGGEAGGEASAASVGLSRRSDQLMAVLLFFLYNGIEITCGTWLNSVLVESRGFPVPAAGLSVTVYYAAIMAGRFLSGIVVNRLGNMRMIRLGLLAAVVGGAGVGLSSAPAGVYAGMVLMGLGLAPVYPCLMHETPRRFTKEASDRLIGYQVGASCLGGSIVSAGTGMLLSRYSLELLFPVLVVLMALSFAGNEALHLRRQVLECPAAPACE